MTNNPQNFRRSTYSPPTPPVRTLEDFKVRTASLTNDYQLTAAGKDLVKAYEWKFDGDSYRQAWGYLFARARQLGLKYCKHFKQFYKPLPPRPALGDRVRLTSTRATGTVVGYTVLDVVVSIDNENREAIISREYLLKI